MIGAEADMGEMRDYGIFLNVSKYGDAGLDGLVDQGTPHELLTALRLSPRFREDAQRAFSKAGGDNV